MRKEMRDEEESWERSRSKKATKPVWSPRLLSLIRTIILREFDDFVLIPNLAHKLTSQPHEVARCLNELVKEGLLLQYNTISYLSRDGEPNLVEVYIDGLRYVVTWNGKQWVNRLTFSKHSRKTGRIRFGSTTVKESPIRWDGKGYYIIRGEEFATACERENLPTDPTDPWICKSTQLDGSVCNMPNRGPEYLHSCRRCYTERDWKKYVEVQSNKPECPRCGSLLKYKNINGKKKLDHSLTKCNASMVKFILEC